MVARGGAFDPVVLSYPSFLLSLTCLLAPSRLARRGPSDPGIGGTRLADVPGMICPVVRTGTAGTKVGNCVRTVDENAIRIPGCCAAMLGIRKSSSSAVGLSRPPGKEWQGSKSRNLSCGRPTGRPLFFGLDEQSVALAGDLSWRRVKTWACRFG